MTSSLLHSRVVLRRAAWHGVYIILRQVSPESTAILDIPTQVALIGFNVNTLARILSNNASAINPNSIGFEAFNETEIPLHAQR